MTKREAEATFRETHMPAILKQEAQGSGRVDKPGRSEAWGIYTDSLCKDGQITSWQYMNWLSPRWLHTMKRA